MMKIHGLLELVSTPIVSTAESTIKISEDALFDIQTCWQNAHEKIEFLKLESQLQQDEFQ